MRLKGNPGKAQFKFSESTLTNVQRSSFNRSKDHKTTFDAGYLIPILVDEVLPGDTVNMRITAMLRMLSPLTDPIMDNMYCDIFGFFVPDRLTWEHHENFMGAQPTGPAQSTSFIQPTVTAPVGGVVSGTLYDYFGLPIGIANFPTIRAAYGRGYNLIYNDWFRDENLQNASVVDLDDGPDTYTDYVILRRGKRKDYFTSALPWTQKINDGTVVTIGLSGMAPVIGLGANTAINVVGNPAVWETNAAAAVSYAPAGNNQFSTAGIMAKMSGAVGQAPGVGNTPQIFANLGLASGFSVNSMRLGVQLQRLFERDARGGTRYVESLWSHFGVRSPDFRMQRSELLFTGYAPLNAHPVPQTSASGLTGGTTSQGDLAAFVTGSMHGQGFTKSFVEHGILYILASVRADLSYSQGVERKFTRSTRYDFYWPTLAHIGEQAILNQEIYLSTSAAQNTAAFGYTGRYNEYRYSPSLITGLLRPAAAGSLDVWHLSQEFGALPTLGSTFIQETPPMTRVKAVTTVPDFIADFHFESKWARCMSVDAIPGLMDHF